MKHALTAAFTLAMTAPAMAHGTTETHVHGAEALPLALAVLAACAVCAFVAVNRR